MPGHSLEPWSYEHDDCNNTVRLLDNQKHKAVIAEKYYTSWQEEEFMEIEANFRRILACINFCRGIPSKGEKLNCGIGAFVESYLDSRRRCQTPEIVEVIAILKRGGG